MLSVVDRICSRTVYVFFPVFRRKMTTRRGRQSWKLSLLWNKTQTAIAAPLSTHCMEEKKRERERHTNIRHTIEWNINKTSLNCLMIMPNDKISIERCLCRFVVDGECWVVGRFHSLINWLLLIQCNYCDCVQLWFHHFMRTNIPGAECQFSGFVVDSYRLRVSDWLWAEWAMWDVSAWMYAQTTKNWIEFRTMGKWSQTNMWEIIDTLLIS